jgi:hypothetical protein
MWVFNYTIKCTIRHNYQCSEPETAHNRRVIYCSLCLYYSARSLMLPGCLHTALLPRRQSCRYHAKLTNIVLVPGPWIVSETSTASFRVARWVRKTGQPFLSPDTPNCTNLPWSHQGASEGSFSPLRVLKSQTGWPGAVQVLVGCSFKYLKTPGEAEVWTRA